ncbi:PREDICTED: nuclear export mediator factor NEMF-like [Populus euphratica]|uniref:Nuclear export mediator factor NEMF-like n=1 Tax=Populus euphratica TaxID=75702 RepID=A0AAJ6TQN1_POPEU|nr:PREDICTED: nuclear export mediator factor NEMF-like [Populus euphratica]
MAEFIEHNLQGVDSAILAVPVALAEGIVWEDLARMVKDEKMAGNPIAGLIDKLHFEKNCMIEVVLALSAHANSQRWYELKKSQERKQGKTFTPHKKAFKLAEKKIHLQLSQV